MSAYADPSVHIATDEEIADGLAALKAFIAETPLLTDAKLSDSLLKRTLYAKHCDLKPSKKLLLAYADWHLKHLGSAGARLSITQVHAFLLTGILQVLPGVEDKDGHPIAYMRPNMYKPGKIPTHHVVNALVYLLDVLTSAEDGKAAKYGFTFVCDMRKWGWSNFGTSYASQFFSILSGRFPVRIRKFVLVNAPGMFPMVWKLIKPMMSPDLAAKFTFVTDATIETLIDTSCVPEELGGTHKPQDMVAFVKACYEREGIAYPGDIDVEKVDWKHV